MDLAVPGSSDNIMCPKCFALMKAGTDFCSECGASIARGSEGSDTEVYQELARANLLKMRGNSKDAIDVCLGILRRFPNNVTAHTLLGDVYAEQGDLKQAAEWYEMALDLSPDSDADKSKLAKVRERMAEKEAASTVKQLGIPDKKDHSKTLAIGLAVAIVVVGAAAFFVGQRTNAPTTANKAARIDSPVTISADPENLSSNPNFGQPSPSSVTSDQAALATLQAKSKDPTKVIAASEDPRGPYVIATLLATGEDVPIALAVQTARDAYAAFPTLRHLTVRVVKAGAIVLLADITRENFDAAMTGATVETPVDQLAPKLLSQVWPPSAMPTTPVDPPVETTGNAEPTGTTGDGTGEGATTEPNSG